MSSMIVRNRLVRGSVVIGLGIVTGNIIGFARVALMAYMLGTGSLADSLVVAIGPLDALNGVLINSIIFAFVPMLTEREGPARIALFIRLNRYFSGLCAALTVAIVVAAPWLMRLLAPGLHPDYFGTAVANLRILSFSTLAAGITSIYCALLYTDRRFAPAAFYQACLNLFTVGGALLLWRMLGVYAFRPRVYDRGTGATGGGMVRVAVGADDGAGGKCTWNGGNC